MVVGFPPEALVKFYYAVEQPYLGALITGGVAVFFINLFLIVFLFLRNTRNVEKSDDTHSARYPESKSRKAEHLAEQGSLPRSTPG